MKNKYEFININVSKNYALAAYTDNKNNDTSILIQVSDDYKMWINEKYIISHPYIGYLKISLCADWEYQVIDNDDKKIKSDGLAIIQLLKKNNKIINK